MVRDFLTDSGIHGSIIGLERTRQLEPQAESLAPIRVGRFWESEQVGARRATLASGSPVSQSSCTCCVDAVQKHLCSLLLAVASPNMRHVHALPRAHDRRQLQADQSG